MYEELVKRLRERAEAFNYDGWVETASDYEKAADAIEEQSKPKWISVTERLPEPFKNVLVANKRGKRYDIDKGWWNGTFFDRCAKGGYHKVTHWMPLPEPPKEET